MRLSILLLMQLVFFISSAQDSIEKLNSGIKYFNQENYEEAVKIFTDVISQTSDIPDKIYFYRAYSYSNLGQHSKAIKDYTKYLNNNSNDFKSHFYCGVSYYELKEFNKAEIYFKKAISIKSDFSKAIWQLGALYEKQGNLTDALDNFNEAIKFDSLNVEYYFKRAIFKSYKLNDNTSALIDIEKVVQLDNNYKKEIVLTQYITLLIQEKRIKTANDISNELIKANINNPLGYYFKGFTNILLGNDGCDYLKKAYNLGFEKAGKYIIENCE